MLLVAVITLIKQTFQCEPSKSHNLLWIEQSKSVNTGLISPVCVTKILSKRELYIELEDSAPSDNCLYRWIVYKVSMKTYKKLIKQCRILPLPNLGIYLCNQMYVKYLYKTWMKGGMTQPSRYSPTNQCLSIQELNWNENVYLHTKGWRYSLFQLSFPQQSPF